jgi:hypothetical protein
MLVLFAVCGTAKKWSAFPVFNRLFSSSVGLVPAHGETSFAETSATLVTSGGHQTQEVLKYQFQFLFRSVHSSFN